MTATAATASSSAPKSSAYDVEQIRAQFPILHQKIRNKPLAYLDNAASSQKPQAVLDAIVGYYTRDHANIHRGVHTLSARATEAHDAARRTVQSFLGAADDREIIFVRGTTEAINLVVDTYGAAHVGQGDEVLITAMEHHANLVPWQQLCKRSGARLVVCPINDRGELELETWREHLSDRTKIAAFGHASNALGTINPIVEMTALAKQRGAVVLIDGAQAAPHGPVDVQAIGCDFYAFSGHKVYGPTGIGVLYGRLAHLETMRPYQYGGDMITTVTFEDSVFNRPPARFEAGTPDICGAVALAAALDWLRETGVEAIAAHERDLLEYATAALASIDGLRIIGTSARKVAVVSFVFDEIHAHDVGTILDSQGVAVRTGHHCAEPLMRRFGITATSRASFACYNTRDEVDQLVSAVRVVRDIFG